MRSRGSRTGLPQIKNRLRNLCELSSNGNHDFLASSIPTIFSPPINLTDNLPALPPRSLLRSPALGSVSNLQLLTNSPPRTGHTPCEFSSIVTPENGRVTISRNKRSTCNWRISVNSNEQLLGAHQSPAWLLVRLSAVAYSYLTSGHILRDFFPPCSALREKAIFLGSRRPLRTCRSNPPDFIRDSITYRSDVHHGLGQSDIRAISSFSIPERVMLHDAPR